LYYNLPGCATEIIDFFRECTVNSESVGFVCSFAAFDFEKHGNAQYGAPTEPARNRKYVSNNGKLEQSFLNFKANHPNWDPGVQGSQYLSRVLFKRPLPARSHVGVPYQQSFLRPPEMEQPTDSYLPMESMLQSVHYGTNVGRELVAMLDAFYDSNKRS
jgi:autophagy-related protein 9